MFEYRDFGAFKQHLRDFLVQVLDWNQGNSMQPVACAHRGLDSPAKQVPGLLHGLFLLVNSCCVCVCRRSSLQTRTTQTCLQRRPQRSGR